MNTLRTFASLALMVSCIVFIAGCEAPSADRPPEIRYGESTCVDCDMIISDERFAAATMVKDSRGRIEALLFDDVGDQIRYEREHTELVIVARWVHDYGTKAWIPAEQAWYLLSPALHTPMASGIAAFAKQSDAQAAQQEFGGDVLGFGALWVMQR